MWYYVDVFGHKIDLALHDPVSIETIMFRRANLTWSTGHERRHSRGVLSLSIESKTSIRSN